jgi:hypothetical protein
MKIPPYFLETTSYSVIHMRLKPIDRNLILYRIGKALGLVQ